MGGEGGGAWTSSLALHPYQNEYRAWELGFSFLTAMPQQSVRIPNDCIASIASERPEHGVPALLKLGDFGLIHRWGLFARIAVLAAMRV